MDVRRKLAAPTVKLRTRTNTFSSLLGGNLRVKPSKSECPELFAHLLSQKLTTPWIQQAFQKRECSRYVQSKDANKCGCGRAATAHSASALAGGRQPSPVGGRDAASPGRERWSISKCTETVETDAFGTIEFQGGPHPHKAQYVRLGFDSDPTDLMHLFENVWRIEPPKLVITVHGGIANFDLQPKLSRVFRKGLLKAAKTTGAWIITNGINAGVVRHVAAALNDAGSLSRNRIVTIGIAPWGLLKRRDDLVGKDRSLHYHPLSFSPKGRFAVLNEKHSYFLLVDNGTVGRYGADIILRKRLEEYISQRDNGSRVPVVCVVLEGGTCTIRSVLDYVTNTPPVPVVICDGSGRAADLLAWAERETTADGALAEEARHQITDLVQRTFTYSRRDADKVVLELLLCVRKKHLINVFRLGEDQQQDIDHAILTALLKGLELSAPQQLELALAWNREDIALTDIFIFGQEWSAHSLDGAMLDALVLDRVGFVRLLLQKGVSMHRFLTMQRLEDLYNTDKGPQNTLYYIVRDVRRVHRNDRYSLMDIGMAIEKLMGSAFTSTYTTSEFKQRYDAAVYFRKGEVRPRFATEQSNVSALSFPLSPFKYRRYETRRILHDAVLRRMRKARVAPMTIYARTAQSQSECGNDDGVDSAKAASADRDFDYPFNELFIWAVLTKRHEMAKCMWEHGEQAMAKALVATKLFKSLAREANEDYLEVEITEELRNYSDDFRGKALSLLHQCYENDDDETLQLLTYELKHWGCHTCLSLAVVANHKDFLAHPCCQILLADLWHGGLRIRRNSHLKVLLGIIFPPSIVFLEFKTREELQLQPQTAAEHADVLRDDDSTVASPMQSDADSDTDGDVPADDAESGVVRNGRLSDAASVNSTLPLKKARLHRREDGQPAALKMFVRKQSKAKATPKRTRLTSTSSRDSIINGRNSLALQPRTSSERASVAPIVADRQPRLLPWRQKLYEFYVAPLTTMWSFAISYIIFIIALTYMNLVRTPPRPNAVEWFVAAYVFSIGLEQCRRILVSEPPRLSAKLWMYAARYWNCLTSLAVLTFMLAFGLRFSETTLPLARVVYACNATLWFLKLLELLSVHSRFGPYITMVGKMLVSMAYILTILTVVLMSFGLARQSIENPDEQWDWMLVRNIFYKPYFMLYGEVYAGEIDRCGDDGVNCVPGFWLPPVLMVIFLLVANILLINLLIAIFNNIFQETNAISQQMWKFQRYEQVMDYEASPVLPPPFTVLCYIYWAFKWGFRKCCSDKDDPNRKKMFDYALKLFLDDEQIEKLLDFEEDSLDDLRRKRIHLETISTDERVRKMFERTEFMSMKLSDVLQRERELESAVDRVNKFAESIQSEFVESQRRVFDMLQAIHASLAPTPPTTPSPPPPPPIVVDGRERTPAARKVPIKDVMPLSMISEERTSEVATCKNSLSAPDVVERLDRASATGGSDRRKRAKFSVGGAPAPELTVTTADDGDSAVVVEDSDIRQRPLDMGRSVSVPPDDTPERRAVLRRSRTIVVEPDDSPASLRSRRRPSVSRRPDREYTSIADAIGATRDNDVDAAEAPAPLDDVVGTLIVDELSDDNGDCRGDTLRRAKPSFIISQNEVFKEYEETGSRITGGLINGRIRKDSASVCMTSAEELKEMGLSELDIQEYLQCLESSKSDDECSSSLDSLNSSRLEDAWDDEDAESGRKSAPSGSRASRNADNAGFKELSACLIDHDLRSRSASEDTEVASPPPPPPRTQPSGSPTPHSSLVGTPLTSPGSKAGLVFTFDADDLQRCKEMMDLQHEQRAQSPVDDEE